ncbi:MAG: diguanylate cyclase [Pseudoxanthomonas sp.]|nr:diguanylate cyclase [Pseudoxanthomonas sp.]
MAKRVSTDATPDPDRTEAAKAGRELLQLQHQTHEVRVELNRLRAEIVTEHELTDSLAGQLAEANQSLLLSVLEAQTNAEDCQQALGEAERSSQLDPLTELPNRLLLLDRLTQAIAMGKRHGAGLALLFLDINNFKEINDTLGHTAGDDVLKLVAQRLAGAVREADTVSRYGGDEFLILLPEVSSASDTTDIAVKVIAALAAPILVGEHVLRVAASIGISLYPEDGEEAQVLIDRADQAMYRAKRHGLGGFVFYGDPQHESQAPEAAVFVSRRSPLRHFQQAQAEHEVRYVQMREANQQLVLAALSAQELQAAAERAQQRQVEFLAVVAHELRTPLTPIRIAATMLGERPDAVSRMQAIIERQVLHMSRLVGDLLDVSRVNTGKLRLEREAVDVAMVVDEAVDNCRPAMDTRLQQLVLKVQLRLLLVHGDPVRLVQVLSNLLDNASRYTPQAGAVTLSLESHGNAVVLTVSDSGIGITPDALPKVFEPFAQDAQALGFNNEGLGLGLTVVRELVEAHGGTVAVSSAGSGLGSQFTVTLPLMAGVASQAP